MEPVNPTAGSSGASRTGLILGGIGAAAFLGLGIFLIVWAFSGDDDAGKTPNPGSAPLDKPSDARTVFKPILEPRIKIDPRIKIVQPSVDKGVAFLRRHVLELEKLPVSFLNPEVENYMGSVTGQPQPKATVRPGYAGLVGLALLEGGLPHDDPAILRLMDVIRQASPQMIGIYDLSASLFFLNRLHESAPLNEKDRALAQTLALRIIAGQLPSGIWGYTGVIMTTDAQAKLLSELEKGTYKPSQKHLTPTMSCTQFAMLAVWSSRKHGVPVREPMLALAGYCHEKQNPDGSWNYPGHKQTATSTCAGLIALALERVLLEDKEFASKHPAPKRPIKANVHKAFQFLGTIIGRKKEDPNSGSSRGFGGGFFDADAVGDLYFLWTLERVGVIYSMDTIDGKDWFDWAYPIVVKEQQDDGRWEEKHRLSFGPLIDTSFALLFLTRANIAKDVTQRLRLLNPISKN